MFDVDGAETEEKAYCREVAAAVLRAALPALFEGRDDLVGDHHWWRLSLEEHRRALEAEASHD